MLFRIPASALVSSVQLGSTACRGPLQFLRYAALASAPQGPAAKCSRRRDAHVLVYFHTPQCDVFWEDVEHFRELVQGGGLRPAATPRAEAAAADRRIQVHNGRIRADHRDYLRGRQGDWAALEGLQIRMEQDMLDTAYVTRISEYRSRLARMDHPSDGMVLHWMRPAEAAFSLLQDCVLFRDADVSGLAAEGAVEWLPSQSIVDSYMQLLSLPAADPGAPADNVQWAATVVAAAPNEAALAAAASTLRQMMRNLLLKSPASRRPDLSNLTKTIGHDLMAQCSLHLANLRHASLRRGARAQRLLREGWVALQDTGSLDAPEWVKRELPKFAQRTLSRDATKPQDMFAEAGRTRELAAYLRKALGPAALPLGDAVTMRVGAVLLHLLIMQQHDHNGHALVAQPVPWQFAPGQPGPDGQPLSLMDLSVQASSDFLRSQLSYDQLKLSIFPVYGPRIRKPRRWENPKYGCYDSVATGFRVNMVRTKLDEQMLDLESTHKSAVYSSRQLDGLHLVPSAQDGQLFERLGAPAEAGGRVRSVITQPRELGEDGGLSAVYDALEVLGNEGWTINRAVLEVVQRVWSQSLEVADVPPVQGEAVPEPPAPHFHARAHTVGRWLNDRFRTVTTQLTVAHQPVAVATQRRAGDEAAAVRRRNMDTLSQRTMFLMQLQVALQHEHFDAIYFPHNVDFRGRAYPMPPHLNHMGNDLCRGLLQFAVSRPLGAHGFRWLLVHLANVYGEVDKAAFDDRVAWAQRHLPDIVDSVHRPLAGGRWWLAAEKPWSTLATCVEIVAALDSGDVTRYESRLPVHQDGSCNGLQHYAALGRDEEGARAVNLVDSPQPQDVYSQIAVSVRQQVAADAAAGHALAGLLQGLVDRKLVKQTVMTTVYGVTNLGARDQIIARLLDKGWPRGAQTNAVAGYAAGLTMNALAGFFSSATSIMAWLRQSASIVVQQSDSPVKWTTPLGLPVSQPYYMDSVAGTQALHLKVTDTRESASVPHMNRQRSAFPPNYIHSLDATHMMMTALKCQESGISFAGVHDSFWTHAGDVPKCRQHIREQFVQLYRLPLLLRLRNDLLNNHPGVLTIPEEPAQANFDLGLVEKSTYFFN